MNICAQKHKKEVKYLFLVLQSSLSKWNVMIFFLGSTLKDLTVDGTQGDVPK